VPTGIITKILSFFNAAGELLQTNASHISIRCSYLRSVESRIVPWLMTGIRDTLQMVKF
jgi:hypothetical protein